MSRTLRLDPDRRMDNVVRMAAASFPEADFGRLDPAKLPFWIAALREAEASTRLLRKRLESLAEGSTRTCPVCSCDVVGRADRVYCGSTCRQRARRAVQGLP